MNVFRFCRWSLAALPVFFMFTACDKLLPTSGSGELVPVKIRSVSVKGYGEASGTRSAGGEKRIVGEPIIRDLGNGMLAEITVEEDVSALRASKPLDDGVLFRVIAVESNGKVYSYGDYKVEDKALVLTNNTNFHVLDGVDYSYIFISFNNSTLPPAPTEGETLPATIAVTAGTNDLIYKRITSQNTQDITVVDGVPVLKFNDLTHKLARIKRLVLKVTTGKTITGVVAGSITLNAASSCSFNLTDGTISNPSGNTVFSWPETVNPADTVESERITFIPQEKYTFSFAAGAISWTDGANSGLTKEGSIGSDKFKFEANGSYTVTLKISRLPKFASSNIYWENGKLAFKPYSENPATDYPNEQYYQGVYFKWGSLIGISPVGDYSANATTGTILYWPNDVSKRTWKTVKGTAWTAIPSYDGVSITSPAGDDAKTLLHTNYAKFTEYKGDICNYIDQNYRMPTRLELDSLKSYYKGFNGEAITVSKADGTHAFTDQHAIFAGIVFPAPGTRGSNSSGTLHGVGNFGYYWSGSADSGSTDAYLLYFYSSIADTAYSYRSNGFSVRCVLIE